MVDLVVLPDSNILVTTRFAYFTIWRHKQGGYSIWGKQTVSDFLKDYFGFHHDQLALVAVVLIAFPIAFASIFAFCIGRLNFQRR
ncbi:pleiotropic drug resistance protein 3-like [Prunus yedoensis var. nudiflora]|uniref:Pleiotropic drug resistance protein 3-like n=1 Tax=Prunus yedoensis var. nudiflora TaxID=2094558 RepID=A0A314UK90_PRUYE|nr:pleiotropic drug resistance protein 3-like [Prunus yedoensis var. nudiflora]